MRAEEKIEKTEEKIGKDKVSVEVRVKKGVVEILKDGKVCGVKPEMLEQLADFLERKKSLDDSGIIEALNKHDRYGFCKGSIQNFYNELLIGANPYSQIACAMAYELGFIDEKSFKVSGLGEKLMDTYSKIKPCVLDNCEGERAAGLNDKLDSEYIY